MSYHYLYVLIDENKKPFYVGTSAFVKWRYQRHCLGESKASPLIRQLLSKGLYPDILIINHFDNRRDANFGAEILNSYFARIGNKLYNTDYNPPYNVISQPNGVWHDNIPRNKKGYSLFVDDKIKQYWEGNRDIQYAGNGYCTLNYGTCK